LWHEAYDLLTHIQQRQHLIDEGQHDGQATVGGTPIVAQALNDANACLGYHAERSDQEGHKHHDDYCEGRPTQRKLSLRR
jgi:hypothetical protein